MTPKIYPSRRASVKAHEVTAAAESPAYPFTAIVGQEELKLALLLNVIAPSVGGVLIMGHRGTGKSTAVRALAGLLPPLVVVADCQFNCDPDEVKSLCDDCRDKSAQGHKRVRRQVPIVELPLNATEDRVCGTLNFERALAHGVRDFAPGLLARANRGFLYIDEVNLLEDHLVDLLLDVAATGRNRVERESFSLVHPARFVLVGSGNPEEGELRPQLLDRFGLCCEIETLADLEQRIEIVSRRERFDRDAASFCAEFQATENQLARRLLRARRAFDKVEVARPLLRRIAELCLRLKIDGHRGELTVTRAARALAAFENRREATADDVRRVAALSLRHRLRRDPLAPTSGGESVERASEELFGSSSSTNADETGEAKNNRESDSRPKTTNKKTRETSPESHAPATADQQPSQTPRSEREAPPLEGRLPTDFHLAHNEGRTRSADAHLFSRERSGGRNSIDAPRGRFTRTSFAPHHSGAPRIALVATLFAAINAAINRPLAQATRPGKIEPKDLRYKRFSRKLGTLYIFAVDASGSMALNRIRQAKGALAHLLRQSYVRRDRVALISFRGQRASVQLAPSQSPAVCKRLLDALPVGGATPLSSALLHALEIARRVTRRQPRQQTAIKLLIFT
ncbi:MAG: magnesium chelatase ATPase subunit I, partial [Pyrinomonadaceae bacterium]|nr:magnesium chelatase ATPase subunit I [Pyrinomonadaceae bacterium]